MRKIYLLFAFVSLIACQQRKIEPTFNESTNVVHDSTLYEKIVAKFGEPKSIDSNTFVTYKWESVENEYGRKFKYLIDKSLDKLPETTTDFEANNREPVIIDTYTWETPKILVIMKNSFWENKEGKIQSLVEIRIDNK